MKNDKTIETVKLFVSQIPDILFATVYGSFALDKVQPSSDLDLAILGEKKFLKSKLIGWSQDLGSTIQRQVDIIDLQDTSGVVVKDAFVEGIIIKNQDPDLLARRLYRFYFDEADYQRYRQAGLSDRRKEVFGSK